MNTRLISMEISSTHDFFDNSFRKEGRVEPQFAYSHLKHHDAEPSLSSQVGRLKFRRNNGGEDLTH